MEQVCDRLSVPFELSRLPHLRMGSRRPAVAIRDYYDGKTRQFVEDTYAWELERFGYEMPA